MDIEQSIEQLLLSSDARTIRLFAASCAERLSPVFGAVRDGDESRREDVALVVETLNALWDARAVPESFSARLAAVTSLEELQPNELGIAAIADTYAFYAVLVLMYATRAVISSDPADAARCSHACLTALGQLDQNVHGASFHQEEVDRQLRLLESLILEVAVDEIRESDRAIARRRLSAIVARLR
jgi:hypothetical protein